MPNHLHGIIILTDPSENNTVETRRGVSPDMKSDDLRHATGMSLQHNKNFNKHVFSKPVSGSLSIIINHFKASVTRRCKKVGYQDSLWQPGYYDHIIRTDSSLSKIREYIKLNPLKWEFDEYFTT